MTLPLEALILGDEVGLDDGDVGVLLGVVGQLEQDHLSGSASDVQLSGGWAKTDFSNCKSGVVTEM